MEVQSRGRLAVWMPLLCSLILVVGMVLGFNMRDTLRQKRDLGTVVQRNDRLEEIIDLVDNKYVDTVNTDDIYKNAVDGILKSLDPHTSYIPAEDLEDINDDLEGGFSGVGIEFSILRDTVEVTSVVEDGPAKTAGIEVGDQIIKVDDTVVAGKSITSDQLVRLLKGQQHSRVAVTVKKNGKGKFRQLTLVRDIIPIYSVDASIMADALTGYIKISRFSSTTHTEFAAALKKLQAKGAKQLIIDLRGNPGGYVDAATSIADDLLDSNKLIVYTQGSHSPKQEYRASEPGLFEKGKVTVLVDETSASASEILAGAIQDWDRGVIVGRRTFGKGLVQEQYDLPDGAALRLTIARYYTPTGRSIQRSFANGREAYREEYEKRFEPGELSKVDTAAPADTQKYYTSAHRVVYSGGGIKPDVYVPYDTSLLSGALLNVVYSDELKAAVWDYFIKNKDRLRFKNISDFAETFNAQEQVTSSYLASLDPDSRKDVIKELSRPSNDHYLKQHIKAQVARFLFQENGYYTISLKNDVTVSKALEVMNSAQYSKLIGGK